MAFASRSSAVSSLARVQAMLSLANPAPSVPKAGPRVTVHLAPPEKCRQIIWIQAQPPEIQPQQKRALRFNVIDTLNTGQPFPDQIDVSL